MDSFVATVDGIIWGSSSFLFRLPPFMLEQKGIQMRKNLTLSTTYKVKTIIIRSYRMPKLSTARENRSKAEGDIPPKVKDSAI